TGMPPVFFGQTLIGAKMPNLTYMLGFDDIAAKEKGWATFMADPRWNKLKNDPAYKDTVSAITNIMLRPADCSQI
ncbi:MAG TPA: NIPSNAP family protein, partial [Thermoguttaceae bacterium]|nr:NIPSNAP family protein [Thermoguttaceae bacterium]